MLFIAMGKFEMMNRLVKALERLIPLLELVSFVIFIYRKFGQIPRIATIL